MHSKSTIFRTSIAMVMITALLAGCATATPAQSVSTASKSESAQVSSSTQEAAKSEATTTEAKKWKIVCMPKFIGVPFFNRMGEGVVQAGKDLDCEVIFTGPTVGDAAEQVKMLEDLINQNIDAIVIGPNDAAALTPVLQKARDKGILILDCDTQAEPQVVDYSVNQVDNTAFGKHMWDTLIKSMGTDSGEYAIITGSLTADNLNSWIDAGKAYAEAEHPNLKLVATVSCEDKQQTAYQQTLDLLKTYPDLKGVVGISTLSPLGAAQAVQEKGLQGKVAVVGTALPNDAKPFLKDGSMSVISLWDPFDLGYLSIYYAKNALDGNPPKNGHKVETINKVLEVRPDNKTIIMGEGFDFTKENVDQFPF